MGRSLIPGFLTFKQAVWVAAGVFLLLLGWTVYSFLRGDKKESEPYYGPSAASADGAYLAAVWRDKKALRSIRVWDGRTAAPVREVPYPLPAERGFVKMKISFTGDGRRLLVQTDPFRIVQWETAGWTRGEDVARSLRLADGYDRSLVLSLGSASDLYLAYDGERTFLRFRFGATKAEAELTLDGIDKADRRTLCLSPDGRRFFFEGYRLTEEKGQYKVTDVRWYVGDFLTGKVLAVSGDGNLRGTGYADCVAFSRDGKVLSLESPGNHRALLFLDAATGRELHRISFPGDDSPVAVWFRPDGLPAAVHYYIDRDSYVINRILLLDAERGWARSGELEAPQIPAYVTPDGSGLVYDASGASIGRRNLATGAETAFAWPEKE